MSALRQTKVWASTDPGVLALGTLNANWAVSEVKVRLLDAGK